MIVDFNLLCELLGRHRMPSNRAFRQRVVREYKLQVGVKYQLSPHEYAAFAELVAGLSFACERLGIASVLNICLELQKVANKIVCVEIEYLGKIELFDLDVFRAKECEMLRGKFASMLFAINARKACIVHSSPYVDLYDVCLTSYTAQFDLQRAISDAANVWQGIEDICTTATISRSPSPALTV